MVVIAGRWKRCTEGRGVLPSRAVALRSQLDWAQWSVDGVPTCSVPHRTTMPSSREALELLALTKRSCRARVMGEGPSLPNTRPYFVAVISKNCISRRMLFSAEISRSIVLYMGWNCEFCVCGNLIFASNCPTKRIYPLE